MRQNYLKLFVDYARNNRICYLILDDGNIAHTYTIKLLKAVKPKLNLKFGSKAAYEWLISQERKEI